MLTMESIAGAGGDGLLEYILRNPSSLLYSNPNFMRLVGCHLNAQTGWLVAKRDSEVVGLLPYMVKDGPLGPVYNSLAYYGSNGGVIQNGRDDDAKLALIQKFYAEAESARACSATIVTNPLAKDSFFYETHTNHTFRDQRIGQITHFPENGDQNDLMSLFLNPRPRNIRRALKDGVVINKSHDTSAMEFLYQTHVANMQAIGGLEKDKSFFEAVKHELSADQWTVFTATLDGKPIAALLLFYFNNTVEYFTPVIIEAFRNTQALALAIYEAMQDAMSLGYKNWNWGGTWLNQGGVYDFKKRWGTNEYPYYYYIRMFNSLLTKQARSYLLEHYRGFYVIPFNHLISEEKDAHA